MSTSSKKKTTPHDLQHGRPARKGRAFFDPRSDPLTYSTPGVSVPKMRTTKQQKPKEKALKRLCFKAFIGEPGGIRTHDLLIRSQTAQVMQALYFATFMLFFTF